METYKLNNCVEKIFKGINVKPIPNGEVKYYELNMKHFDANSIKVDLTDVKSSDKVSQIEKRMLKKGDIIIPARMELGDKIAIFDIESPLPCIINHQYWIVRPDTTMINNYYLLSFLLNKKTQFKVNIDRRNVEFIKGESEYSYTEKLQNYITKADGDMNKIQKFINDMNEAEHGISIIEMHDSLITENSRPDIVLPNGTVLELKRHKFKAIAEDSLKELLIKRPSLDEQKKMENILKSLQQINEFKNVTKNIQDNINATLYNTLDTDSLTQELVEVKNTMKNIQNHYDQIMKSIH